MFTQAMWDYVIRGTEFLASLATIAAIIVALRTYFEDRKRQIQERQERRRSLLLALQEDTTGLSHAIGLEDKAYQRTITEEFRYSHVWAYFSSPVAEDALRQSYSLSLTAEEIADLISIRIMIHRINALVMAKQAVVTGLAAKPDAEPTARQATLIDARIRELLPNLANQAESIFKWTSEKLKGDPTPESTRL